MTASHPILSRLDTGRPLLVGGDPLAGFRAQGLVPPSTQPCPIGRLLRESPSAAREHYHQEVAAGVDVLGCLTADTIPRALQQIGMAFRAAALTACAVDLALDVADLAPRPVLVAGVLGNDTVGPAAEDRIGEELGLHAARLATAGCELILARGFALCGGAQADPGLCRVARRAAIVSGAATGLPTWAVVRLDHGGFTLDRIAADACARHAFDDGAELVVFEVPLVEVALAWLDRLQAVSPRVGFALAAGGLEPDAWASEARRLLDAGVRVLGGAAGTTPRHLGALFATLHPADRPSLWPHHHHGGSPSGPPPRVLDEARALWDAQRLGDDVRE